MSDPGQTITTPPVVEPVTILTTALSPAVTTTVTPDTTLVSLPH